MILTLTLFVARQACNFQEVVRMQMMWGANQTLAILREFKKIGPAQDVARAPSANQG